MDLHRPDWPLPDGVHACFTGRRGGVSLPPYDSLNLGDHVGDAPEAVIANRTAVQRALSGIDRIQWLTQVHGTVVLDADANHGAEGTESEAPVADASTSQQPGTACAVMTADCLPVLFCNSDGSRVAAAHAGWRGLADGILLETLKAFDDVSQVSAYLCPAIGPKAFEVGPDVRDAFASAPEECFKQGRGDRLFADLFGLARWQLEGAGVAQVYGGGVCTYEQSEDYFSYRRDGVTGRQVSLIWIHA